MKGEAVQSDYLLEIAEVWLFSVLGRVRHDNRAAQQVRTHNFCIGGGVFTLRLYVICFCFTDCYKKSRRTFNCKGRYTLSVNLSDFTL
jgi:hypothetical protein